MTGLTAVSKHQYHVPRCFVRFGNQPSPSGIAEAPYEQPVQMVLQPQPAPGLQIQQAKKLAKPQARILTEPSLKGLVAASHPLEQYVVELVESTLKQAKKFSDKLGHFLLLAQQSVNKKAPQQPISDAYKLVLQNFAQKSNEVDVVLPTLSSASHQPALVRDLAEQTGKLGYNPYYHRQNSKHPVKLTTVALFNLPTSPDLVEAVKEGQALASGTNFARFLVDSPANIKTPTWIVSQVQQRLQSPTLNVVGYDKNWITQQNMGLFLSVAQGNSDKHTPKMLEMVYTPQGGQYDKTILLVGKGIVFDTGGTNLKSGAGKEGKLYIHGMHGDMAGAAAVIGAMKTIDKLQIPGVRVVGLAPLTPNLIGKDSTIPHDRYTARNGKRVEVSNTDAEGRLILADAIHYGGEVYRPDLIVDIATLTGGKVRALGAQNSVAVMGNDQRVVKQANTLLQSLGRTAQAVPLTPEHRRWVTKDGKGKFDVYNSVAMKDGEKYNLYGTSTKYDADNKAHMIHHSAQGGAFIKEFLYDPKTPWVHLDMAGAEFEALEHQGGEEYATGFGVKDIYSLVKAAQQKQIN